MIKEYNLNNILKITRGRNEARIMRIIKSVVVLLSLLFLLNVIPIVIGQGISPVVLSNIELVTVDENSASVTWVTNLESNTAVQYGTTPELGDEIIKSESVQYHISWLTGLDSYTTYYYRIGSGDRWSDVSSFTTLASPGEAVKIKFAIVSDTHYDIDGQASPNGAMYGDSVRLVQSMVTELNMDPELDFVIANGDLTNQGTEQDYSGFALDMDELAIPWYPVLGNHDKVSMDWSDWYEASMGRTVSYYSFDFGGYHIIVLDSAIEGSVQGDLDSDQLSWLADDLDEHSVMPTLIFLHHMADRSDINGISETAKSGLEVVLDGRTNVLSITSGHTHENIVTTSDSNYIYVSVAAVVSYPIGYSIVKLYDSGYSQAFQKLESELETSERSRVKLTGSSGPSADDDALGELTDRSFIVENLQNLPPSISNVIIDPEIMSVSETATVTVLANDPDGDLLTYDYRTSGGTITGTGSVVTYYPPDTTGFYDIFVTVSDGSLTSEEKSIDIEVTATPVNRAPKILGVWQSSTSVKTSETVELTVTASDEDGDSLNYHYSATAGTITGTGKSVTWQAPTATGTFTISVWVSDGKLDSDQEEITITVTESKKKDSKNDTPGFEIISIIFAVLIMIVVLRYRNGRPN
jgi:predicted phosphodiesterase